jgi:hypothetical protein
MKKVVMSLTAFVFVALSSSCSDNACYECSQSIMSIEMTVDICEDQVTTNVGGTETTVSLSDDVTSKEYAETLETSGYTCNKK